MSNVVSLFGNKPTPPVMAPAQPDAALEGEIDAFFEGASMPMVLIPIDVLQTAFEALGFYARQGWDGGANARKAIVKLSKEPE